MPIAPPPQPVINAALASTTRHTRRIEIYEADGITRWSQDKGEFLADGSVNVDYSRDERRTAELTLDNISRKLISAPKSLWYDKVIKVFRGLVVEELNRMPRVLVVADAGATRVATAFKRAASAIGYGDVRIMETATTATLADYEIVVGLNAGSASRGAVLENAFSMGKSVITFGDGIQSIFPGMLTNLSTPVTKPVSQTSPILIPGQSSHPLARGWSSVTYPSLTPVNASVPPVMTSGNPSPLNDYTSVVTTDGTYALGAFENKAGARWAMYHYPAVADFFEQSQVQMLLLAMFDWVNPLRPITAWETQIGEFLIDSISRQHFPNRVTVSCRDYTKKLITSKFAFATSFEKGQKLEALIASIAGAAGVTKRILPTTPVTVNRTFFYERGVTRWEAIKDIATAYNYELFFDPQGYLVMRETLDPATTPPTMTFQTGVKGNLASFSHRTTDTRIYNTVVVTGESSDADIPPVYAIARNTDATSPTSIAQLGERVYEYVSSFITTKEQAQAVADSFLAVHALEEYEISLDSLMLPWLEAGEVLAFKDPEAAPDDPENYLLSSLDIPLTLGTMSITGKRVIKVA